MKNIKFEKKALRGKQSRQSMHQRKVSARIRKLFSLCDEEGKGYVTREELFRLTKEIALTQEEVNNAFYYLDKDKNGSLSLEEFMTGFEIFLGNEQVSSGSFDHQEISDSSQLFDHIDKNRKGFITKEDLSSVSDEFSLGNDEIEEIFLALNRQGRTVLTYQDFKDGLESLSASEKDNQSVAMEEEIFSNGIEDDSSDIR